jgi:hypothetical protein
MGDDLAGRLPPELLARLHQAEERLREREAEHRKFVREQRKARRASGVCGATTKKGQACQRKAQWPNGRCSKKHGGGGNITQLRNEEANAQKNPMRCAEATAHRLLGEGAQKREVPESRGPIDGRENR